MTKKIQIKENIYAKRKFVVGIVVDVASLMALLL